MSLLLGDHHRKFSQDLRQVRRHSGSANAQQVGSVLATTCNGPARIRTGEQALVELVRLKVFEVEPIAALAIVHYYVCIECDGVQSIVLLTIPSCCCEFSL